jgi:hypothetical protein
MNREEEENDKNLNAAKPVMAFLSIAGLLFMVWVLQSTAVILDVPIAASRTAFAQQQKPTEIISTVKTLLNQTIKEYRNQNFTGAQSLASSAYLDHFEFIEAPLEKHDKVLKENTEIMLREQLRQSIKDKLPVESIQQLVSKINSNLNKAEQLLAQTDSSVQITTAVNSSVAQTLRPSSSISASNTNNKVLIAGDESDQPYMPSSITIRTRDKVAWINRSGKCQIRSRH